jgi:methionyl-tRNA synthetase
VPRIFIGVSWPYANGPVHIGQLASTYLPADIFARYHRLRDDEVLMVSGSDMHGTPILVTAEKEGTTPETVAQRCHEVHRRTFERIGISFDLYTSTRTIVHERTVKEVFLSLLEHGYVRRRTEESPYCPKHARFLPDRYTVGTCPHCGFENARGDECDRCGRPIDVRQLGQPRCALCDTPAEFRASEHFYLELDKLEGQLAEYVAAHPNWRNGTRRVAENFLAEGLHPTTITRDLDWGVPIPLDGYASKRFYVWFEALVGYLSASREWASRAGRAEAWRKYWDEREPVRSYYFVGKDNRFHHTILWPGMLIGAGGLVLPYDVPANEWMNLAGEKLSKSRSTELPVFLPGLLDRYAPDIVRFYAALLAPQNHDTEFDPAEFDRISEEILSNQYGNLAQRTLVLVRERHGGSIPAPPDGWDPFLPGGVGERLRRAHQRITEEYEAVHLKEALDLTMEEVREANRVFHEGRPWALSLEGQAPILYETIWRLRAIALWLSPVLPFSSERLYRMLGFPEAPHAGEWDHALLPPAPGQLLGNVEPLFPRRETRSRPSKAPSAAGRPKGKAVLDLRAGVVQTAAPHPDADRLYVLTVDLGEERPRTIIAGVRDSYRAEDLPGRRIVVLSNLAPRTIRGQTSHGMLLAAELEGKAILLEPDAEAPPPSAPLTPASVPPEIDIDSFRANPIVIARVVGRAADGSLELDAGTRRLRGTGDAPSGTLVAVRLDAPDALSGELLTWGGRPVHPSSAVPPGSQVR